MIYLHVKWWPTQAGSCDLPHFTCEMAEELRTTELSSGSASFYGWKYNLQFNTD